MIYTVRVKLDNNWMYSTSGVMEPVEMLKRDKAQFESFLLSKTEADQVYKLLSSQASFRSWKALAIVEMSIYSNHISERAVVQYREF